VINIEHDQQKAVGMSESLVVDCLDFIHKLI